MSLAKGSIGTRSATKLGGQAQDEFGSFAFITPDPRRAPED
jgi:hypothetical protein